MTTGPLAPRFLLVFPGDGESGGKIGRGGLRGVSTTGRTDRKVVQPRQADRDAFVAVVAGHARENQPGLVVPPDAATTRNTRARESAPSPSMSNATSVRRAEAAQVPRCGWDAVRSSQMPRRVDPPVRCYKYWGNNGEGTGNVSDEARDRGVSCEGRHH